MDEQRLPQAFRESMKQLLGTEYEAYCAALEQPPVTGIRTNRLRCSSQDIRRLFPYLHEAVPWCAHAFYCGDKEVLSRDPYYAAGLYYIQEPSAMLPAQVLPVKPGDYVLDLCAAPGGKTTELAARMQGKGILVANDRSASRASTLVHNIEKAGITNCVVTVEEPYRLAERFAGQFDAVLVDAPCSGEGMFRKEPSLIRDWLVKGPEYYAPIQREILIQAWKMVRDGGVLVYSTCTFSSLEDEENIRYLLEQDADARCLPIPAQPGFVQGLYGTRLYPHRIKGEGHFVCLIGKGKAKDREHPAPGGCFHFDRDGIRLNQSGYHAETYGPNLYMVPDSTLDFSGLRVLRSGLLIGEEKKKRMEYAQALAMALTGEKIRHTLSLPHDDPRVARYLRGETLNLTETEKKQEGEVLVMVDRYPLGFARINHGLFKNKYPKGWIQR